MAYDEMIRQAKDAQAEKDADVRAELRAINKRERKEAGEVQYDVTYCFTGNQPKIVSLRVAKSKDDLSAQLLLDASKSPLLMVPTKENRNKEDAEYAQGPVEGPTVIIGVSSIHRVEITESD